MKTKRYIAYFLFFISMIMLVVPVIPHHHHEDGVICMKNDLPSEGCCHHQSSCNEHCCCDTGCMTTHFYQKTPNPDNSDLQPGFVWVNTLFSEPILKLLTLPEETGIGQEFIYLESLHGHVHYTCHRASRTSFCSCLTDSCRKQILCRHRNDATWLHNPFTNFVFQNK